jgi:hypothetical protein
MHCILPARRAFSAHGPAAAPPALQSKQVRMFEARGAHCLVRWSIIIFVQHSIPAPVVFLSLLVLPVAFVACVCAQMNGGSASGFGGRAVNPPASVTSRGPNGDSSSARAFFSGSAPTASRNANGHHRRHNCVAYAPPVIYAVPVPYAVDIGAPDKEGDSSGEDDDQGGPTIFDRRGVGAASYIPPVDDASPVDSGDAANASVAVPDPPQEPTLLIFKDGRKLELGNYAIIGQTLFDLSPGRVRKIALAELDLEATRQQNDNRGISFQLPPPQAN